MQTPQTIDPRDLWCWGRYTRRTPNQRGNKGRLCPEWKQEKCPLNFFNKPDEAYKNIPFRLEINWRRKRDFANCQLYKLKQDNQ